MELNRLRVIAAIAREGTVTAAADVLGYSQPAVSQQLARLESDVGVALTTRVGRGIKLTEAGRLLADRAEEILGRVDSARSEVAAHAGLRAGRVRVVAFPSALATIVPTVAVGFTSAYPDVDVALDEAEPPEALARLRSGEADLAFVFSHGAEQIGGPGAGDITVRPLFDEPIYAVTPRNRRWRGRRDELSTYRNERWIAGCPRCREHLVESCAAAGFSPSIAFATDDYVAAQSLVAAGLGVSTLPGLALIANRHPAVRIDELAGDRRQVQIATIGGAKLSVTTQAFLDVLANATLQPPNWPRSRPARKP